MLGSAEPDLLTIHSNLYFHAIGMGKPDRIYKSPVQNIAWRIAMPTKTEKHLYPSKIDIPESTREKLVELLNQSLATTTDLYSQLKQAHWNIKGPNFYQLHLLFDDAAGAVFEFIDLIAERVTTISGVAHGTVRNAAAGSILPEYPSLPLSEREHLTAVTERLAAYAKHVREAIEKADNLDEPTTADLYTQISRAVDTKLWFVEAHIQH
jgi:starvation-inducible DNA-binding protein